MKTLFARLLAAAAVTLATAAHAQITFYEHDNFGGRSFTAERPVDDFARSGFNDRASSVVVRGGPWEVCDDAGFRGRCQVLRAGSYPSLGAMDLGDRVSSARAVADRRGDNRSDNRGGYREVPPAPPPPAPPVAGQITFYENDGFQGRAVSLDRDVADFGALRFNDRASSVVVLGERWEACEDVGFRGRCVVLRPGRYPNLASMGMNDRLSSVRLVQPAARYDDNRYAPPPPAAYDWRRRPSERLYEVNVTSARAVYAAAAQRCWVERGPAVQERRGGDPNVGGAVLGGLLGGILGHQVGGGTGRDLATVGGAVGGAVIGANVNRGDTVTSTRDVQRCAPAAAQGRPDYWDVTYDFRGVEHHLQAPSQPGPTVTVNEAGEPRL